jgi:ATP-dependent Clp protease protease subunit
MAKLENRGIRIHNQGRIALQRDQAHNEPDRFVSEPIRLFDGPHKPHEAFWQIKNPEGAEPEIELYGYISEYSWWDDEITPAMFKEDLNKAGQGGPITVRINSGGGDVFAASVMRSILVEYPGRVTVRVDGLAASAATVVATAGDVVRMQDTAYWMIHDPIGLAWGNIEELKQMLDTLKTVKNGILDAYQTRTGMNRDKLSKMMTDETWFSASEAKEVGFIDEVIGEKTPKAVENVMARAAILNSLRNYRNVPDGLLGDLQLLRDPVEEEKAEEANSAEEAALESSANGEQAAVSSAHDQATERFRAEAKLWLRQSAKKE